MWLCLCSSAYFNIYADAVPCPIDQPKCYLSKHCEDLCLDSVFFLLCTAFEQNLYCMCQNMLTFFPMLCTSSLFLQYSIPETYQTFPQLELCLVKSFLYNWLGNWPNSRLKFCLLVHSAVWPNFKTVECSAHHYFIQYNRTHVRAINDRKLWVQLKRIMYILYFCL